MFRGSCSEVLYLFVLWYGIKLWYIPWRKRLTIRLTLRPLNDRLRQVRVRERGERGGRDARKCAFRLNLNPPSNILSRMATSDGDMSG